MAGMDMGDMADMPGMNMSAMKGDLGAYPMSREASGTAWQPESSPMDGLMKDFGPWSTMLHGYINRRLRQPGRTARG